MYLCWMVIIGMPVGDGADIICRARLGASVGRSVKLSAGLIVELLVGVFVVVATD